MKFLLNRNGKKKKLPKLTGKAAPWKSPSMVRRTLPVTAYC